MCATQTSQNADAFAPVDSGAGNPVASFNDRLFIHPDKRLPQLDRGPVKAYAASNLADVSLITHYAMICELHLTPRNHSAAAYATLNNAGLVRLSASGPVYWPPARGERFVFIFEIPTGVPLMPEGEFAGLGMKPDVILNAIIRPLCLTLHDLHDADIAHGNIRPSTLYGVGAGVLERVVLSECLSFPSSFNQAVLFEPVERAMASPLGRGPTNSENDVYALGATMAVLLRTRDPMEGLNEEQVIQHKVENGSLAALTAKDRISGNIIELLRGMLQDDPALRWTLEDVLIWLDGGHVTQKQGAKRAKSARPIHFENERFFRPSLLAMHFGKNQAAAAQLVESKALEQWISRSLEDSAILKRLESATESVSDQGHGPGYWDRLLCRVSIAIDPDAPIRYKGLSVFPEAIGASLAAAIVNHSDLQPYIDIINQQIAPFWATSQPDNRVDLGSIIGKFDACKAFLRQNNVAYGIERCLYILNPGCPCLSDKLRGYYVRTPEDMLRAFERISTQPNRPQFFFDRHIIAFLSAKDRKDIDSFLIDLNSTETARKITGNIKTIATIQQRSRLEKMPGICRWAAEILEPVYSHIHDRELRETLRSRITQLVEGGDISRIASLLDNTQTLSYDNDSYNRARVEYYNLRLEKQEINRKLARPALYGQGTGREVGALVSCFLSALAILYFVFMTFSHGKIF